MHSDIVHIKVSNDLIIAVHVFMYYNTMKLVEQNEKKKKESKAKLWKNDLFEHMHQCIEIY